MLEIEGYVGEDGDIKVSLEEFLLTHELENIKDLLLVFQKRVAFPNE